MRAGTSRESAYALRKSTSISRRVCQSTHASSFRSFAVPSVVDLLELLLLEVGGLGELESDLVSRQLLVSVSHGLKLVLHELSVERVEVDGLREAGLLGDASASADNAGRHDHVVKDGLVDRLEGAAPGALLTGVRDLPLGVNGPVGDDDDGPLELLLQMVDHLVLHLLVELKRAVRDLDQDVLLLTAIVVLVDDLLDGVDVDHAQVLLDVLVRVLERGQRLGSVLLHLGGLDLQS